MRTLIRLATKLIPGPLRRLIFQADCKSPEPSQPLGERPFVSSNGSAIRSAPPEAQAPSTTSEKTKGTAQASAAGSDRLNTKAFAKRLRVSDQTVRNWRLGGKIHGVRSGRSYVFPSSQIMPATSERSAQLVPGLEDVFKQFASTDEAWTWLTTDMTSLRTESKPSDTPIQALRQGRRRAVLQLL